MNDALVLGLLLVICAAGLGICVSWRPRFMTTADVVKEMGLVDAMKKVYRDD